MTAYRDFVIIRLRGGPMDGWLVKPTAAALRPGWPDGHYKMDDPPEFEDDAPVAHWTPA